MPSELVLKAVAWALKERRLMPDELVTFCTLDCCPGQLQTKTDPLPEMLGAFGIGLLRGRYTPADLVRHLEPIVPVFSGGGGGIDPFWQQVFDLSPWMLGVGGVEKRARFFNLAWVVFTGSPDLGWEECVHPRDLPAVQLAYAQAEDKPWLVPPFRLRSVDGSYTRVQSSVVPLSGPDGCHAGWVGWVILPPSVGFDAVLIGPRGQFEWTLELKQHTTFSTAL